MAKISVKVTPNSRENSVLRDVDLFENVIFKVKVSAQPQDGKANEAVIKIIAQYFKILKKNVKIISGLTSGFKILEIYDENFLAK